MHQELYNVLDFVLRRLELLQSMHFRILENFSVNNGLKTFPSSLCSVVGGVVVWQLTDVIIILLGSTHFSVDFRREMFSSCNLNDKIQGTQISLGLSSSKKVRKAKKIKVFAENEILFITIP